MSARDRLAIVDVRNSVAQAYLAAIVESSDDAIIAKDLDGIVQWCNAATERMFGYSSAELVGRPVRILIPADRQSEEDAILERVRRGERIDHFETVRIAKDGSPLDISLKVSPVRDGAGKIIGVSKTARDITALKRAAAETSERDRILASERLARTDAERASRAKDDFVAMISHELRTPLNAILGWTELMMSHRHQAAIVDRGLDVVARNTRLQAQLIADLLDISRIVAGKLRLDVQRIDLIALVSDAVETLQQQAASKGIKLELQIDTVDLTIDGDQERLHQIAWNVLSNAIKFTPAGGRVFVALRRLGTKAELSVTDTGAGIAADVLPDVFEQFHQADGSITRRYGGLGLGLSIVKQLVELHGGSVHAASDGLGQGATFTITLPVAGTLGASKSLGRSDTKDTQRIQGAPLERVRVLVVEDELDTREFLRCLLETMGAAVFVTESASEALAMFATARPDILVSDIGLPEIDGYSLLHQIRVRGAAGGGGIPAIALTAYARQEDRTIALAAGYQAHIAKPVESSELVAMIVRLTEADALS